MRSLDIIPECSIDTTLVESITSDYQSKFYYNHQKGCNTVCKEMRDRFADSFAVGIIDDDKKKDKYIEEFNVVNFNLQIEVPIKLLKHNNKNHYIILVQEDAESFILNAFLESGVEPSLYGLPNNKKELKDNFTEFDFDRKHDVYRRFHYIFQQLKSNSVSLNILSFWVTYLRDNNYNANLDYLIQQTNAIINS